jgi:hypothetical protein
MQGYLQEGLDGSNKEQREGENKALAKEKVSQQAMAAGNTKPPGGVVREPPELGRSWAEVGCKTELHVI